MTVQHGACAVHVGWLTQDYRQTKYFLHIGISLQQKLREGASVLRCSYIVCLVTFDYLKFYIINISNKRSEICVKLLL